MDSVEHYTSAPAVRQAPAPEAFELPEGVFRPQAEKFREALTHVYERRLLFKMAGDYMDSDQDAMDLAHLTYEELYRKPTFDTPLTGTVEENADAISSWVRRAMKNNATDLGRRKQAHQRYVKGERQRQSHGVRWARSGSPNEDKRAKDPLRDYFTRGSLGGNEAHAKTEVARLRLRWPHSIAVLMRVYAHGEPMTEVAKDYGVAARTLRDRVTHTREALRAYGEWEQNHGGLGKNTALVAEVDAMERLWAKSAR